MAIACAAGALFIGALIALAPTPVSTAPRPAGLLPPPASVSSNDKFFIPVAIIAGLGFAALAWATSRWPSGRAGEEGEVRVANIALGLAAWAVGATVGAVVLGAVGLVLLAAMAP